MLARCRALPHLFCVALPPGPLVVAVLLLLPSRAIMESGRATVTEVGCGTAKAEATGWDVRSQTAK